MTLVLVLPLMLSLAPAVWRVIHGPTRADRLMAVQLFGTIATATLLILAQQGDMPPLRDVALVIALLAAMVSAALVQFLRGESLQESPDTLDPKSAESKSRAGATHGQEHD